MPVKKDTDTTTEAPPEVKSTPAAESVKIPVMSARGKAITKTEFGYDFENIHIKNDVPLNVIALAFVTRAGETEKMMRVKEEFFVAQAFLNNYALHEKKHRIRERNGVITYGNESFTIPGVSPEVFLRIIDDNLKSNKALKQHFAGKREAERAQAMMSVSKTLKLLTSD